MHATCPAQVSVNYVYISEYITGAPRSAISLALMAVGKLLKHALLVDNRFSGFNYDVTCILISNSVTSVRYQVYYINPRVSDDV